MGKGPGLYSDIGKKARDLLYKDYHSDQKIIVTTYSPTGVAITSTGTKKGDLFIADVNTQLKNKNVTTDIKVDTNSNEVPFDLRSAALVLCVVGTNAAALGTDVSFDSMTGCFTKCNAGLSFSNTDLIASLTLNDKGDTLSASYYHTVKPLTNTAVGGEVAHSFSTNENTITVGTQHSLDPLTMVKARVNNLGKASALIQHEWRPRSFFTLSGEVDTKAVDKSAKFGLALALKP
ncbi:voltage dependent anion channel 1 [Actinidia rufa]|uniref:Voltage dependent anion channel 1 n=1 Tax=Actinidia rufa TaxID=165716 RepID=A0A7J0EGZ7_9ERIC|nr:voltage dependent anion channel 1 [Actinidia rufa]